MAKDYKREEDEGGYGSPYCWKRKQNESFEDFVDREEDQVSLLDNLNS